MKMSFLHAARIGIQRIPKRTIMVDSMMRNRKINPFSKNELVNRIGGQSVRMSHEQIKRENQLLMDELKNENWIAVYRYPGVRFAVLLARAKLIQTIASVFYLPYSTYQFMTDQIDANWYYTCAGLSIFAPLMLMIFSRYLNRLVGVIAMNETNEYVRVGYLTFWGARKDQYLELSDVLSLSEVGSVKEKKMVKFMWFSGGSKFLYLPTKHAEIVDEERAELLFGDISIFDEYKNN